MKISEVVRNTVAVPTRGAAETMPCAYDEYLVLAGPDGLTAAVSNQPGTTRNILKTAWNAPSGARPL